MLVPSGTMVISNTNQLETINNWLDIQLAMKHGNDDMIVSIKRILSKYRSGKMCSMFYASGSWLQLETFLILNKKYRKEILTKKNHWWMRMNSLTFRQVLTIFFSFFSVHLLCQV